MRAQSGRHLQNWPRPADRNNERPHRGVGETADANLTSNLQLIPQKKTRPIRFSGRNGIPTANFFSHSQNKIQLFVFLRNERARLICCW